MDDPAAFRRTESFGRAATAGVLSKPGLELRIGSNIFRSTNGVVTIHGKEQLVIEAKPEQGLLLATLDLYDERGTRIAHLRRNVLTLNDRGRVRRRCAARSKPVVGRHAVCSSERSTIGPPRVRGTNGIGLQSRPHRRKIALA